MLIIILGGVIVYLYFLQVQKDNFPENNYADARDEAYQNRQTWIKRFSANLNKSNPAFASLINFNHLSLLLITFGVALLITMLSVGLTYGVAFLFIGALLVLFSPASLPMFPGGLMAVITQTDSDSAFDMFPLIFGWFIYFVIFLLGTFIKSRPVFTLIYLAFLILLIMNIIGCTRITPEFLSGIN